MTTPEPQHTKILRATGSGTLVACALIAIFALSWMWVLIGLAAFVGTAVVDTIWGAVDRSR